ncbi:MAG: ThiF family adenylyltransferase [Acidobacteriota bacterium]
MSDERYARHELIPGWRQSKLRDAVVLIAGVGALGNEVARLLTLAGVGHLVLCDPDRIETTNLSRTGLFRPDDVGRLKVETAAQALRHLVPGLRVETRPLPLVNGLGLAEMRDASLVLGCLDSRLARLQLSGRCQLVQIPWIDGGSQPWGGEVRFFRSNEGACYGCSLGESGRANLGEPWSCLDKSEEIPIGASAPLSALVGAWMATLAVRHLMALPCPDGALVFAGETGRTRNVILDRDPGCPFHAPLPTPERIKAKASSTVGELRDLLAPGDVPLVWALVQAYQECGHCGFSRSVWRCPPRTEACFSCGGMSIPRSTLELLEAPEAVQLRDLGVAPREILAVRRRDGLKHIELSDDLDQKGASS